MQLLNWGVLVFSTDTVYANFAEHNYVFMHDFNHTARLLFPLSGSSPASATASASQRGKEESSKTCSPVKTSTSTEEPHQGWVTTTINVEMWLDWIQPMRAMYCPPRQEVKVHRLLGNLSWTTHTD